MKIELNFNLSSSSSAQRRKQKNINYCTMSTEKISRKYTYDPYTYLKILHKYTGRKLTLKQKYHHCTNYVNTYVPLTEYMTCTAQFAIIKSTYVAYECAKKNIDRQKNESGDDAHTHSLSISICFFFYLERRHL